MAILQPPLHLACKLYVHLNTYTLCLYLYMPTLEGYLRGLEGAACIQASSIMHHMTMARAMLSSGVAVSSVVWRVVKHAYSSCGAAIARLQEHFKKASNMCRSGQLSTFSSHCKAYLMYCQALQLQRLSCEASLVASYSSQIFGLYSYQQT